MHNLLQDALNEIEILKTLNHKNIISLFDIYKNEEGNKLYLFMEYAECGSIMQYNDKTGIFKINETFNKEWYSEEEIKKLVKGMAEGLAYCKYFYKKST
jgi:serine/threonine protein kinase